jgi:hypothetical protein
VGLRTHRKFLISWIALAPLSLTERPYLGQ